ncbi:MAG: hypothetical protein ACKPE6_07375 [Gammaproteobacteria bacterium]
MNRVATFVFMIDERFYGTLTAFVPGEEAALYRFTSGLPVRLLGHLMPTLAPLLDSVPAGLAVRRTGAAPPLAAAGSPASAPGA